MINWFVIAMPAMQGSSALSVWLPIFRVEAAKHDSAIYRRLLIGRDGHLDQSEAYDIS